MCIISIDKLHTYRKYELNPNLAEMHFNSDFCQRMIPDIKERGIINPLVVIKREDEDYDILLGHNRFLIAKHLNIQYLPCEIVEDREKQTLMNIKKTYTKMEWE